MPFLHIIAIVLLMLACVDAAFAEPLTPEQESQLKPGDTFQECKNCPEMIVVPAGSFTMGASEGEAKEPFLIPLEGPRHVVTIGRAFAVGKFHVTRDQYEAYLRKTGHQASSTCDVWEGDGWVDRTDRSWRNPGFAQDGTHPVVCVSWADARAYVEWIARETSKPYRLLSEAEFEYAARGRTAPGVNPRYWFGDDDKAFCQNGNGADQKARDDIQGVTWTTLPCNDGYAYTSPVGYYTPNAFGLYDMAGNAWQWMADCWHDTYNGAPVDGSAWVIACSSAGGRVFRGGSWWYHPTGLRAAGRNGSAGQSGPKGESQIGFRLARSLPP